MNDFRAMIAVISFVLFEVICLFSTVVMFILKLAGEISIGWFIVFLPLGFGVLVFIFILVLSFIILKR